MASTTTPARIRASCRTWRSSLRFRPRRPTRNLRPHISLCRMDFRRWRPVPSPTISAWIPITGWATCRSGMSTCSSRFCPTLIMNLDYTGTKGTRLDILEAPNRTATGVLFPGVQPFYWEDSVGDSTANALSVRVRKRLAGRVFDWRPLHFLEIAGQRFHHRKRRAPGGAGCRTHRAFRHHQRRTGCLRPGGRARLVQFRSAAQFHRRLSVGASLRPSTGGGSRATARCGPSSETGTGAATGPSLPDCPSLPGFWATPRM